MGDFQTIAAGKGGLSNDFHGVRQCNRRDIIVAAEGAFSNAGNTEEDSFISHFSRDDKIAGKLWITAPASGPGSGAGGAPHPGSHGQMPSHSLPGGGGGRPASGRSVRPGDHWGQTRRLPGGLCAGPAVGGGRIRGFDRRGTVCINFGELYCSAWDFGSRVASIT